MTRACETGSQWDAKVLDSWCACSNVSAPRRARVLVQVPSLFCWGRVVRERTSKSKFSESPSMWSQVLMQTLWLHGRESETNSGWGAASRSKIPPVFIIPAWDVQVGITMYSESSHRLSGGPADLFFLYLGFGKRARTDLGTTVLAYGILCVLISMLLFVNHPKITSQQHSLDKSAVSDCWHVCVCLKFWLH